MEVVTLGTGTLVPQAGRASAGVLVLEDDRALPLDLGRNVLSRMVEAGIDPLDLDHFLLTHLHPDHSCELVSLLFGLNYGVRPPRQRPVRLIGPAGLQDLVDALARAWPWLEATFPLEVREIGPGTVDVGAGWEVEAVRLEHGSTEDLGYRVRSTASGRTLAFTGDTGPCPALEDLARGVDLLVAECSSTDADATEFHLSPTPLGRAAAAAGARRLVLTHLYPETPAREVVETIREIFPGPVDVARDGERFAL